MEQSSKAEMVMPDRREWMGEQQDFNQTKTRNILKVNQRPPLLLNIALALQHLRCWSLSGHLKLPLYPVVGRLSVLLSVLLVWVVCAPLQHCGHITLHSVSELLFKNKLNTPPFPYWKAVNTSNQFSPDSTAAWLILPYPGLGLPLLSGDSIAAGIAAGLSSCISSQAVYVLTARLLNAPTPPAQACNRGLSVEGLGSVITGLMGAPVGFCSSVPNACAVLSVTYTVASATGITYLQYTDIDSGRNIFNTGFTVFMSLVLPRWFRSQPGFISTGTLSEKGFERDQSTRKIQSLADKALENRQSLVAVYEAPQPVRKVLDLPGLRSFPFCACRSLEMEKMTVTAAEISGLLPH
ncbi:Solute carrier family 23 member 3 [Bagarius yarrelli]|uniref:Solute carrier family 23 member 3 n=1 Tax=Bagarius yarrelli TaxID=175774 RepID=A0A556TW81_BAGYA|nr:Solute carrier family 23 member 3 [Bagarius yarrelli]